MWNLIKPVVRWPLRSPLRLLGVVVVIAALILTVGALRKSDAPATATVTTAAPSTTPTPTPSKTASMWDTPTPSPSPLLPGQTDPGADVDSFEGRDEGVAGLDAGSAELVAMAAADAAVAYVTAWAHPDRTQTDWLAGLAPYVTARHYEELKTVDPANTANIQVTGPPIERAMYRDSASLIVPTTGDYISVYLIVDPAGIWLVTNAEPTRY